MTTAHPDSDRGSKRWATLRRFVLGAIPEAAGEAPPVVYATRSRLLGWLWTAIGFVAGGLLGLLLVLCFLALSHVPALLVGFGVGVFFGAAVVLILSSRIAMVRRGGAVLLLLSPLLVLLAPFLLLGAGIYAAKKIPRRPDRDGSRD